MSQDKKFMYPMFKMILWVMCIILCCEYAYSYCVYNAASFGILYLGDTLAWFLAGFILFTEGLEGYLRYLVAQTAKVPLELEAQR